MPIYIYRCKKCKDTIELQQSFKEGDEFLREGNYRCLAPDCGGTEGERVITTASFILEGRGWYNKGGY